MATSSQNHLGIRLEGMSAKNHLLEGAYQLPVNTLKSSKGLLSRDLRPGHAVQHCAQLESCTVCPPLKLLRATLRATVAEVESAPTLQHHAQLFHRVSIICNIACNFVTQCWAQSCIVCPRL